MALSLPPWRATIFENSPGGIRSVPLNIRCSRKCGRPDLPTGLSAVPIRYHSQWATTGARRFGTTMTSSPFSSVKHSGLNSEDGTSSAAAGVSPMRPAWAGGRCVVKPLLLGSRGRDRGAGGVDRDDVAGLRLAAQPRHLGLRVEHLVRSLELLLLEVQDVQEGPPVELGQLLVLGHDLVADVGGRVDRALRQEVALAGAERRLARRRGGRLLARQDVARVARHVLLDGWRGTRLGHPQGGI